MLEGYPGLAHRAQPGVWVRPGYKGTEVTVSQAITLKEATQAGFGPYLYICAYVACVHMGVLQGQEQSAGLGAAEKTKIRKTRWISVTAIV